MRSVGLLTCLFVCCNVLYVDPLVVVFGFADLAHGTFPQSDFTLLGDCINTSSRVASLAVTLKSPLLFSFEVRCLLGDEMRDEIETAGMHQVCVCRYGYQCCRVGWGSADRSQQSINPTNCQLPQLTANPSTQ